MINIDGPFSPSRLVIFAAMWMWHFTRGYNWSMKVSEVMGVPPSSHPMVTTGDPPGRFGSSQSQAPRPRMETKHARAVGGLAFGAKPWVYRMCEMKIDILEILIILSCLILSSFLSSFIFRYMDIETFKTNSIFHGRVFGISPSKSTYPLVICSWAMGPHHLFTWVSTVNGHFRDLN